MISDEFFFQLSLVAPFTAPCRIAALVAIPKLARIGVMGQQSKGTVELLEQNHPRQFMR